MEAQFLSLGMDIIGLGVFNYDFRSLTTESPVIKVTHFPPNLTTSTCASVGAQASEQIMGDRRRPAAWATSMHRSCSMQPCLTDAPTPQVFAYALTLHAVHAGTFIGIKNDSVHGCTSFK